MRPAAFIFCILMLFFTAQPLLVYCQLQPKKETTHVTGCCRAKSCQKKGKEKEKKSENRDCDNTNSCNPFASCARCQYVAVYRIFCIESIDQKISNKSIVTNEDLQKGYLRDCWHPPKVGLC